VVFVCQMFRNGREVAIPLFVGALGNLMPAWKRERDPCIDMLV